MISLNVILLSILAAAMLLVIYYDARWRRIPNFITLPLGTFGLIMQIALGGWSGMAWSLLGLFIAVLLFLPLYLVKGMGAGDLKLMAALGAFLGIRWISAVFFFTILCGGVLAMFWLVLRKSVLAWKKLAPIDHTPVSATLPYGWAIAAGTTITVIMHFKELFR